MATNEETCPKKRPSSTLALTSLFLSGASGALRAAGAGFRSAVQPEVDFEAKSGMTRVFAELPAGEHVFRISAKPPEGPDSWKVANYHFRVLVLPE